MYLDVVGISLDEPHLATYFVCLVSEYRVLRCRQESVFFFAKEPSPCLKKHGNGRLIVELQQGNLKGRPAAKIGRPFIRVGGQ